MRFLVTIELGSVAPKSIGDVLQRIEEEWEVVAQLCERGIVLAAGKYRSRQGAVAIFEGLTRAAVESTVRELPLAPYFASVSIEELIPVEQALSTAKRRNGIYRRYREDHQQPPAFRHRDRARTHQSER